MATHGLPYPITKGPLGILRSEEGLNIVKGDLLVLLLTNPGERVMLPNYGTNLRQFIFEPNDAIVESEVEEEIARAIRLWEPRVTVEQIEVTSTFDKDNLDIADTQDQIEHILGITISFYDPDNIKDVEQLELQIPIETIGG